MVLFEQKKVKDKKRNLVKDLLKAHPEGLTIQEIMDKTKLARHTVLARLHRLEGEGKVKMRQINMAKLYSWTDFDYDVSEEGVKLVPLEDKHLSRKPRDREKPKQKEFDLRKVKEDVEKRLRNKEISRAEAQVKEQKAPVEHVIEHSKKKEADFSLGRIKEEVEKKLRGKKKKKKKLHDGNKDEKDFLYTGIQGFDSLLTRGIPKGTSVLVAGGAGSGKTIFCLQTVDFHASHGEKCLYMSFEESEEKLTGHMEDFGWDPRKHIKDGTLIIKRFNPFDITRQVDALLMKAKGELLIDVQPIIFPDGFKPSIIVVDSLSAIASAFTGKEESYRIYIEQLFRFFEHIGATSFLITETEQVPKVFSTSGVEEFLADGVVVFYNIKRGNVRERAVEILKLRGAEHQNRIVAMNISSEGIDVFPEQEVFGGIGG